MTFVKVLRGNPSDAELAALVAALLSLPEPVSPPRPVRAPWPPNRFASPGSWQTVERR
jgi:hypothetical protein